MKPKTFLIAALVLIVTACKQVATEIPVQNPVVSATSTFAPKSTETPPAHSLSTMTVTAILTVTPQAEVIDLRGIKSGQYVVIGDFGEEILYIVSLDKQIVKKLSLKSYLEPDPDGIMILNTNFAVSDDGTQFLTIRTSPKPSVLFDIATGKSTLLSINQDCRSASWSPDKKAITLSCLTSEIGAEIFTLDTVSGQMSQVTDCHNNYKYCYFASWSTDGHWVAYYEDDERSGQHPRGIMIFDTNCFKKNNCMDEQMGLIEADSNPTWSLQNQLVYVRSEILSYLAIGNGKLNQVHANLLPNIPDSRKCETIKFSPDGNYLACTADNRANSSVYLYSPSSNTFDLIFSSQSLRLNLIGWMTIP
jgi:Tol biopolymer transport system component